MDKILNQEIYSLYYLLGKCPNYKQALISSSVYENITRLWVMAYRHHHQLVQVIQVLVFHLPLGSALANTSRPPRRAAATRTGLRSTRATAARRPSNDISRHRHGQPM